MGITKSFWKWTQSYLGVLSRHGEVIPGVPQGGVISPTLFNVHVNDIEDCIPRGIPVSTCKYADDCTLYELVSKDSVSQMQDAVTHLESWAVQNKMELNAKNTKDMWITFKKCCPIPPPISIWPTGLLGVYVQNDLKWNTHVSSIASKACKRVHYLRVCRTAHLPRDIGLTTYIAKIRPVLEFASPVWGGLPIYLEEDLQRVQNRCLNVIGIPRDTVESLVTRRQKLTRKEFKRILDSEAHPCKRFLDKAVVDHGHNLRSCETNPEHIRIPVPRTIRHKQSFISRGTKLNSI